MTDSSLETQGVQTIEEEEKVIYEDAKKKGVLSLDQQK